MYIYQSYLLVGDEALLSPVEEHAYPADVRLPTRPVSPLNAFRQGRAHERDCGGRRTTAGDGAGHVRAGALC